jgi:hypothetical protein
MVVKTQQPMTGDDTHFQAFAQTVERKQELSRQLSLLDDEREAYRIELLSGKRDPDPNYEYESRRSATHLKRELKAIEDALGVFEQIALSKSPDAERYRELFATAGMAHRLTGTIPRLARRQEITIPGSAVAARSARLTGLLMVAVCLAALWIVQVLLTMRG